MHVQEAYIPGDLGRCQKIYRLRGFSVQMGRDSIEKLFNTLKSTEYSDITFLFFSRFRQKALDFFQIYL